MAVKHPCPDRALQIEQAWQTYEGIKSWRHAVEKLSAEQNHRCCYCGERTNEGRVRSTLEHIIPKSYGGPDSYWNLVMACEPCNSARGNEMSFWEPAEWRFPAPKSATHAILRAITALTIVHELAGRPNTAASLKSAAKIVRGVMRDSDV